VVGINTKIRNKKIDDKRSNNTFNAKIIIAAHKKYNMPSDDIYLPLHVGREVKQDLGYIGDNIGDNISLKNPSYCELTGLYWAWKNLKCDYLGIAHYRRHFSVKSYWFRFKHTTMECILTSEELNSLIPRYKILVPQKRRYYIESLHSHYEHTHYKEHLDITREIILQVYPDYLNEYDKVMKQSYGHMFNMYIMEKELSDLYCEWLFNVLFELEKRVDSSELSDFQGRFYGRVSEILFNVWLMHQCSLGCEYKEIPYIHIEKINWYKKGRAFLSAKLKSKKYEGGF